MTARVGAATLGSVRARRVRPDTLVLAAVLVVAATARLWRLDLMEFKADEANACRLALHVLGYSEPGVGSFFPTAGLVSSVGILNPPLFVYLMALPLAIVRSPIAAVVAVALANVLAIWLTFLVGKRAFSRFVGVASAALLALSPWGIVFSRKIWAQDLLPLCTALFALQLHALLVERKPRAGFWLVVIAAAATQLHFSAWVLVPVAGVALILARRTIAWRWVGAGIAVAVLLYVPFLVFHLGHILHTAAHQHHAPAGPDAMQRLESSARWMIQIVGGGGTAFLIGRASTLGTILSPVLGVAAAAGILAAALRPGPAARLGRVLALWYALPLVALTVLPVRIYVHYFIVLLPLPFLGLAHGVELVLSRRRLAPAVAVAACLVCFAAIDIGLFRTVSQEGGAPGDYGVAYRYTRDAVALLQRRNPDRSLTLGHDIGFAPVASLKPYRFLIWNAHPDRPLPPRAAADHYVLVDTFKGTPPLLRADPRAASYRRTAVGPLVIVTVPSGTFNK